MSYLVLARKWRPQFFRDVMGQEHVTSTLQNALTEDRLAHALIFSGPRGVGKTSIARILAKAINCEKGPGAEPCNECQTCREITAGASVDVQEIDGASNRGIDEIRELRESVKFKPVKSRFKVYVIDEVHMLTKEAFNALLKTLEEPPAHVYFIFATTEPRKIPATINSRCQHYEFHRMSTEKLAEHLDHIVQKEDMGLSHGATLILAREARGSVRDSLSLLDQVAAYGARDEKDVCEALGLAGKNIIADTAWAMLAGDSATCLEIIDRINRLGGDMQKFAWDLMTFFRNLAVLTHVEGRRGIAISGLEEEHGEEIRTRFKRFSGNSILQAFDAMLHGQGQVAKSPYPKIALELMLMRICAMKEALSIDRLIEKVNTISANGPALSHVQAEDRTSVNRIDTPASHKADNGDKRKPVFKNRKPQKSETTPSSRDSNNHGQRDNPEDKDTVQKDIHLKTEENRTKTDPATGFDPSKWDDFRSIMKKKNPLFGCLLDHCVISEKKGDRITLSCSGQQEFHMLSGPERIDEVERELNAFFNTALSIKVCYADKGAKNESTKKLSGCRKDNLKQHPVVQEALNVFNARISRITPEPKKKKGKE